MLKTSLEFLGLSELIIGYLSSLLGRIPISRCCNQQSWWNELLSLAVDCRFAEILFIRCRTFGWFTVRSSKWWFSRWHRLRLAEWVTLWGVPSLSWWRTWKISTFSQSTFLVIVSSIIWSISIVYIGELTWPSVKRSSTVLIRLSIFWISSLGRILFAFPLSGPKVWSSFLIIILGKAKFFSAVLSVSIFFISSCCIFFLHQLGVCVATVAKAKSVSFYSLVPSLGLELPSSALRRCSSNSVQDFSPPGPMWLVPF